MKVQAPRNCTWKELRYDFWPSNSCQMIDVGYGATTLPAISEAISEDKSSKLAQKEIDRLEHLLNRLNKQMRG